MSEPSLQPAAKITCQNFSKNPDGSWNSIVSGDIVEPDGTIRFPPGMTFRKGITFYGIDVVAMLDQQCTK